MVTAVRWCTVSLIISNSKFFSSSDSSTVEHQSIPCKLSPTAGQGAVVFTVGGTENKSNMGTNDGLHVGAFLGRVVTYR